MANRYTKKGRRATSYRSGRNRRSRKRASRFLLPLLLLVCALIYTYPAQLQELVSYAPSAVQEAVESAHLQLQEKLQDTLSNGQSLLSSSGSSRSDSDSSDDTVGSDSFEIHYLDVGEGLSVLVRSDGHSLLYDGGGSSTSSFVVSYLKNQGITNLDYIIASHYDSDHLSGLVGALHVFTAGAVLGPDDTHDSRTYTSFLQAVSDAGLTVKHPEVGDSYTLGSATITILAPQQISTESNNNSIAIRIANGSNRFLLMGDAQTESESAMCASGLPLKCDVICVGHHGSSNSTSNLLLDCAQPSYAVISVGTNDYGHPHQETLQRLSDHNVTVLRTDQLGTIIARSDGQTITWSYQ
jgi:beta-lactamase superfamily II metal-dependent hydrolase